MASHIGVDSYFELYTTLFAWYQYNNLWQILTDTGLVFLPFFGVLLRSFVEPAASQKSKQAQFTSLKALEVQLFLMLTVVILAGQPMLTIKTNELKFVQLCVSSDSGFISRTLDYEKDQSLYKKTGYMKADDYAKVPVWWYAVMGFSTGVSYSLKNTLPCLTDVRFLRATINKARIIDPALRYELALFLNDCFYPAHSFTELTEEQRKAHAGWGDDDEARLQAANATFKDKAEAEGLLSRRFFLPGNYLYYGRRASQTIAAMKISDASIQNDYAYVYGKPLCASWWGDEENPDKYFQNSLSIRLEAHLREHNADLIKNIEQEFNEKLAYAHLLIHVFPIDLNINRNKQLYTSQNDLMEGGSGSRTFAGKIWDSAAGFVGLIFEAIKTYPMVHATQQVAYVVQSLLLLGIYLVIPIGLVFSGYSYQFLIVASLAIFCLKFIAYIFHVVWWLDRNLYLVVKGPPPENFLYWLYDYAVNSPEELKINFVTIGLYFFLPTLTIIVFSWAGVRVLGGLETLFDKAGGAQSNVAKAAEAGSNLGKSAVGTVGRMATRMLARKAAGKGPKTHRYDN